MKSSEDKEEMRKKFEELRLFEIRLHKLRNVDERYSFYYDETNNIRKLHVRDGGLNVVQLKDFVLGGIVRKSKDPEFDFDRLRADLKLQNNVVEIKLKHIAQGDFLDLIKSERMTTLLQWTQTSRLTIHYLHLDPFYWSIVDIVDSIIANMGESSPVAYQQILKCDLYEILKSNFSSTLAIFDKYNYPNLDADTRSPFISELVEMVDNGTEVLPEFNRYMLKGVIQFGLQIESLDFIEDNTPKVLIDNFSEFYKSRVRLFSKSLHIFDEEPRIVAHLTDDEFFTDLFKDQYRFSSSEREEGIQISDIFVGIMGKLHTYLRETMDLRIQYDREKLDLVSRQNLELIDQLLSASDQESNAFFHHVASAYDLSKARALFRS